MLQQPVTFTILTPNTGHNFTQMTHFRDIFSGVL